MRTLRRPATASPTRMGWLAVAMALAVVLAAFGRGSLPVRVSWEAGPLLSAAAALEHPAAVRRSDSPLSGKSITVVEPALPPLVEPLPIASFAPLGDVAWATCELLLPQSRHRAELGNVPEARAPPAPLAARS